MIAENVADDGLEDVRMLNVADLSNCLRVSTRQIHRMNRSALIPAPLRIGGCTRWRAAEIAAWLRAGSPPREQWERGRATQMVGDESNRRCPKLRRQSNSSWSPSC